MTASTKLSASTTQPTNRYKWQYELYRTPTYLAAQLHSTDIIHLISTLENITFFDYTGNGTEELQNGTSSTE
jgi:hypothetical protein